MDKLSAYWAHLQAMTRGYVKDPDILEEQLRLQKGWQDEAARLGKCLS